MDLPNLENYWLSWDPVVGYMYRIDPKFLDRLVLANSVDPVTQIKLQGLTDRHSVCIFWMHYSVLNPNCSNLRIITANFWGV